MICAEAILLTPAGEKLFLADFSLFCRPVLDGIGFFELQIFTEIEEKFTQTCTQLIVTYSDTDNGISRRLFSGFLAGRTEYPANGSLYVTYFGNSLNAMLKNAAVCYPSGTAFCDKYGPADAVLTAYVAENIGQSIVGSQRDDAYNAALGLMAGQKLTTLPPVGVAGAWSGSRHGKTLLEIAQGISAGYSVDFVVDGDYINGFTFQTFYPRYGRLLTTPFAECLQNLAVIKFSDNHLNKAHVIHAYGAGVGTARLVVSVASADYNLVPVQCRNEIYFEDTQQTSLASLQTRATEEIALRQQTVKAEFDFTETDALVFGRDLWIGDEFTFSYRGITYQYQLIEMPFTLERGEIFWSDFVYRSKTI